MKKSNPYGYLTDRLSDLDQQQRLRSLIPRIARGTRIVEPDGTELVNFGGNDYLGFASEPVRKGHFDTLRGSGASALVCGWTAEHQRLAETIADFESTEAAVVFPSGFVACSGTTATLAEEGDLILSDRLNHASLIDGCRMSKAECMVYPHLSFEYVADVLRKKRQQYQRVWIVTDGVFSMDGHVAPLRELAQLAAEYNSQLIVDEAHGTGVLGANGTGVCEALGVKEQVAIRIGTLSKAIGGQGGFVAGPKVVIDYLINRCRTLIYSTSLAPASVLAALAAFELVRDEPGRRHHVCSLAQRLRGRLSIHVDETESGVPIIPILIGSDADAIKLSSQLRAKGFFVPAIRPPTVPEGTARLRVSLSAAHTEQMVDELADAIHGFLHSQN
ncbi:aminotransferase class I/II-fold pyridoxal phosphate-dependent enzyme [Planctomycetes bacterium K23_9]|uniref:8-amino-7-oxononanoate synthase n=1 Tax=Stieleria marina TaxID=1930275 RepID=A0A517P3I1_9BACT|nr:8-amino-7-oxononanoate synthase [Planctomycetes bacterium K23_9]